MKPEVTVIPAPEFPDTTRRSLTIKQKLEVMVMHGTCVICGAKLTTLAETEFHHKGVGKWAGGSDELDNFGPTHRSCNRELGKQEAAMALKADKQAGRKGQRRPDRKRRDWPSPKIPSRPFPSRKKDRAK